MRLIAIFLLISFAGAINADFDDAYGYLKQKEYIKAPAKLISKNIAINLISGLIHVSCHAFF